MRVNVLSGIVSTIFMVVAVNLSSGSNADTFVVPLYMAISTTLLSYLVIFPSVIKLRYSHANVPRPYRVPGGSLGVWAAGVIATAWILLASIVAVFPNTIESWLGVGYDFEDAWGVTRLRFEVFTLGTLAVVILVGVVGYVLGKPIRDREVDVPLVAAPKPVG